MLFDLAIRINGPKAEGLSLRIDWRMTDEGGCHRLSLSHGALSHAEGSHGEARQATVLADRTALGALLSAGKRFSQALEEGLLGVDGERQSVAALFGVLDDFSPMFNILEP